MFSFLQRFKPKQITVVRSSTKKQREADKRRKYIHEQLADQVGQGVEFRARMAEVHEARS